MPNTRGKKSASNANTNPDPTPTVQLGAVRSGNGGNAQGKNATATREETNQPETQPRVANSDPVQPHKGRGRPKKTAVADQQNAPTVDKDQDPSSVENLPRKRVRKGVLPGSELEDEPAAKRAKTDITNIDKTQKPRQQRKAATSQKPNDVVPRDPLPDRVGRNIHPAPKKGVRRSTEEVEAERRAQAAAIEAQIRRLEEAKRLIAVAHASEDAQKHAMDDENPPRLSAALRKRQRQQYELESDEEADGESFDFGEVDKMSISSESEEPATKLIPKKRGKAARVKGALRKEIQGMVGRIHVGEDEGREEKRSKPTVLNLPTLEASPKKYKNAGLRKDPKTNLKKAELEETIDPFECGGLNDDDTSSDRPNYPRTQGLSRTYAFYGTLPDAETLKRDHSRKNNLVNVQSDSGNRYPPAAPAKSRLKTTKAEKSTARKAKIEHEPKNSTEFTAEITDGLLQDRRWKHVFLPTLMHAFYISQEPFVNWTLHSSTFLATVQKVFDLSFSNINLTLSSEDKLTIWAYNRVKSRKSLIASDVLELIQNFFADSKFAERPDRIRDYVLWALRPGGPAYYSAPIPQESRAKPKEPDYIPPKGFLESDFIVPIAKRYLGFASKSVLDPALGKKHPPKGLYALIMFAVERALKVYKNGAYTVPPTFNHTYCWKPLKDLFANLDKVKEERWASILHTAQQQHEQDEAGYNSDADDAARADESMISAFRAGAYVPESSPLKA